MTGELFFASDNDLARRFDYRGDADDVVSGPSIRDASGVGRISLTVLPWPGHAPAQDVTRVLRACLRGG
ncbi:hypothetical protein, partial [Yinghuangia sp. YIM S10712]|uniref:hypothetical protein n=1 Tax=Yinghuangia sp. YIM S10712 TaxID=3436930 RepID=UPI003F532C47